MRLNNSCLLAALGGVTLLTGTVVAPVSSQRPDYPIKGGHDADRTSQYVCVAPFKGGMHPGKARFKGSPPPEVTSKVSCNISYAGKEHVIPGSLVRVNITPGWVAIFPGDALPSNVLDIGGHEASGTRLYSCRAYYKGGLHLGKVAAGKCYFGWNGSEIIAPNGQTPRYYEVLVE